MKHYKLKVTIKKLPFCGKLETLFLDQYQLKTIIKSRAKATGQLGLLPCHFCFLVFYTYYSQWIYSTYLLFHFLLQHRPNVWLRVVSSNISMEMSW